MSIILFFTEVVFPSMLGLSALIVLWYCIIHNNEKHEAVTEWVYYLVKLLLLFQ
jgi:hypothetical protein